MSAAGTLVYSRDDLEVIAEFAGCSLDESPGRNWVQDAGGLPTYICQIARAIKKTGKSTSQAVAIAVSRAKKWAAGADGVDADTRAKAVKAVAEWEKLKAKNKATGAAKKTVGKNNDHDTVKATHSGDVLCLTKTVDYNVDIVRDSFRTKTRAARDAYYKANPSGPYDAAPPYLYVREQWTTFLVVRDDSGGDNGRLFKVPYTVDKSLNVTFGAAVEVKTQYVAVPAADLDDTGLTDTTLASLANHTPGRAFTTRTATPSKTALDKVLRFAAARPGRG